MPTVMCAYRCKATSGRPVTMAARVAELIDEASSGGRVLSENAAMYVLWFGLYRVFTSRGLHVGRKRSGKYGAMQRWRGKSIWKPLKVVTIAGSA